LIPTMEMTLTTNGSRFTSGFHNDLNSAYFSVRPGFTQTALNAGCTLTIEDSNSFWIDQRE
jgi:hypothetical protein